MGRSKAALPFGETTALGLILATCRDARVPAVVVAGADEQAVRDAAAPFPSATIVVNPAWATGRTSSIQAGLAHLSVDALLLWPVDACLPGADVLAVLAAARAASPDALAWIPSHQNRRGHPALLAPEACARLAALATGQPARDVIRALHAEGSLVHVPTDDPAVLMNMNTPPDYERWLAEHLSRRRDLE